MSKIAATIAALAVAAGVFTGATALNQRANGVDQQTHHPITATRANGV